MVATVPPPPTPTAIQQVMALNYAIVESLEARGLDANFAGFVLAYVRPDLIEPFLIESHILAPGTSPAHPVLKGQDP